MLSCCGLTVLSTYKIVKVIKLFKQLAQRILGDFVIIIIYLYNYYYYYYYYIIISRICSISTTTVLRSLHLWLETSVDVLFKNFAADSGSIRAIRECNILLLIPAITERKCNQLDRYILALPVRFGGLDLRNPSLEARRKYASSVKVTKPLVEQIVSQSHQLPEDSLIKICTTGSKK